MRKLKKAIIGVLASAMLMGAMTGCGKAASDERSNHRTFP